MVGAEKGLVKTAFDSAPVWNCIPPVLFPGSSCGGVRLPRSQRWESWRPSRGSRRCNPPWAVRRVHAEVGGSPGRAHWEQRAVVSQYPSRKATPERRGPPAPAESSYSLGQPTRNCSPGLAQAESLTERLRYARPATSYSPGVAQGEFYCFEPTVGRRSIWGEQVWGVTGQVAIGFSCQEKSWEIVY